MVSNNFEGSQKRINESRILICNLWDPDPIPFLEDLTTPDGSQIAVKVSYGGDVASTPKNHNWVVLQKLSRLSDTHFSQVLNKLEKNFFMVL